MYASLTERCNKIELVSTATCDDKLIQERLDTMTAQIESLMTFVQTQRGSFSTWSSKVKAGSSAGSRGYQRVPTQTISGVATLSAEQCGSELGTPVSPEVQSHSSGRNSINSPKSDSDINTNGTSFVTGRPPDISEMTEPKSTQSNTDLTLEGFVPQSRLKVKYAAYYVAGIISKDTDESTIQSVSNYVIKKIGYVRSIRKLREAGNTTSVKLIIKEDDCEDLAQDSFWPDGIMCRLWQN